MNPRTPDRPDHEDQADDDLLFPTFGAPPPPGPPAQGEHPDVIWHHPRRGRRLRGLAPAPLRHLGDAALVLAALAALAALALVLAGTAQAALAGARWCADPQHPPLQLWHTVNDPIQRSLQRRRAGLPAGPATLHTTWAAAGIVILVVALRRGASVGVQLGGLLFGALTAAAVWDGTAEPGRPVAAGLAVLAWAVLAACALTGSWITTHTTILNDVPNAPAPIVAVDVAPAQAPAPVVEVSVPEPRIETVLVVDPGGDARRTSRPDR
ncbi:hypothetical protein [Kitasatospora sp. NPDC004272]